MPIHLLFWNRVSHWPRIQQAGLDWLASEPREACFCLPSTGITSMYYFAWLFFFNMGSGASTQVFMFARQAFHWQSYLPRQWWSSDELGPSTWASSRQVLGTETAHLSLGRSHPHMRLMRRLRVPLGHGPAATHMPPTVVGKLQQRQLARSLLTFVFKEICFIQITFL